MSVSVSVLTSAQNQVQDSNNQRLGKNSTIDEAIVNGLHANSRDSASRKSLVGKTSRLSSISSAEVLDPSTGTLQNSRELPPQARVERVAEQAGVVKLSAVQVLKIAFTALLTLISLGFATPFLVHVIVHAINQAKAEAARKGGAATLIQSMMRGHHIREAAREAAREATRKATDAKVSKNQLQLDGYTSSPKTLSVNKKTQERNINLLAPHIPADIMKINDQLDEANHQGEITVVCKAPTGTRYTQNTSHKALEALRNYEFQERDAFGLKSFVERQILGDEVRASVFIGEKEAKEVAQLPIAVQHFLASSMFNQGHGPMSVVMNGKVEDPTLTMRIIVEFDSEQYEGNILPHAEQVNIAITENTDGSYTVKKDVEYAASIGDKVSPTYHHTSTAVIRPSDDVHGYTIDSLVDHVQIR